MRMRQLAAGLACIALAAPPVIAATPAPAANSAAKLSLSNVERAGAPVSSRSNELGGAGLGGATAALIAAGIAAIVVLGVVIDDDDNDEDLPDSP